MKVKQVNIKTPRYFKAWKRFLSANGIHGFSDRDLAAIDATFLWYDDEDQLVATGSLAGNVLKYLAISETQRESGAFFNQVVSQLTAAAAQRGHFHLFVFTKPQYAQSFQHVGFHLLAKTNLAALLETGMPTIKDYLARIPRPKHPGGPIAAIVMNSNPFTLGHRYLVERAAQSSGLVYVFVVKNDVSLFKTAERRKLVEEGVADLPNVVVVDGGDYQISPATFPAYFLKSPDQLGDYQAHLDAQLFRDQIAPALKITERYVGSEPLDPTTANYNQALAEVLPPAVHLHVIERKQLCGTVISATRVRTAIKNNQLESVKKALPKTSWDFIVAHQAELRARMQSSLERKD